MDNNNDNGGFLWGLLGCCIPLGLSPILDYSADDASTDL